MLLRGAEHAHVPARDRSIKLHEGAPHAFRCSRWRRDAVADRGQAFCYRIQIVNVPTAIENCRRLQLVVRVRSEEHTSELQSLMRISYAVFCLKKKKTKITYQN